MFTPIRTASTAAGPETSGNNTNTAGRLLTMLDSSAATAAIPSSAGNVSPSGSTSRMAPSRPLSMTAATPTPRHNTNARNGTSSAPAIPDTVLRPRARPCTPSTTAPANAAHAGDNPKNEVTANPRSVSARTTSTNTGTCTSSGTVSRAGWTDSARGKSKRRKTNPPRTRESHGNVMTAGKWTNESPAAPNASRLVRLDTGNSSEALLARCAVAYACGLAGTRNPRTVASTTGVSSTTVASRLRIAVVAAAITKTIASKRCWLPELDRAMAAPAARNSPSSSHSRASTSTAARKPTTGSSRLTAAVAPCHEITPSAMSTPAGATAATASGQPRGRTISIRRSDGRWCTGVDHASPHLYAETLTGGTTGPPITPGTRSGGQWCPSINVTS